MELLRTESYTKSEARNRTLYLKIQYILKIRSRFVLVLCVFQIVVWKATTEGMCGVDDGYAV